MDIAGKTALITGAGTGVGRATAILMAERGARLALVGREQEPLDETLRMANAEGGDAMTLAGDVTDAQWREEAMDTLCARFGGPDILINDAGEEVKADTLEDVDPEYIRSQIEADLLAPILLTRVALPALRLSTEGAVVNVSSLFGLLGMPSHSLCAASGGGLARFDEALRRELAADDIHVMTVYPVPDDAATMSSMEDGDGQEAPETVAAALLEGLKNDEIDVIRGSEGLAELIDLNQSNPQAADRQLLDHNGQLRGCTTEQGRP